MILINMVGKSSEHLSATFVHAIYFDTELLDSSHSCCSIVETVIILLIQNVAILSLFFNSKLIYIAFIKPEVYRSVTN